MASKSLMKSTEMLGSTQSENRSGNKDVEGRKLVVRKNQAFIAKPLKKVGAVKYKECMRNYAASIGGHVKDGCFEFMPPTGGDQQDNRDDRCGACRCHRNFHKKEPSIPSLLQSPSPVLLYNGRHLWKSTRKQNERMSSKTSERGELQTNSVAVTSSGKRFSTKYTKVQKGKMLEFAKRSVWRIIQEP